MKEQIVENKKYFTTYQTAKFLLVTPATIVAWHKNKKIKVVRTIGGHRRVPGFEINRIWDEMNN